MRRRSGPPRRLDAIAQEPVELIDRQERFEEFLELLEGAPEWAIDTEFHRERSYYPRLALLQIAWPGGIVLIDPLAVQVSGLSKVLDSDAICVVHAADQDLQVLERACGTVPRRLFDTQICAGFIGYSSPSLLSLVESLIGVRLQKGDQLTDWMRRPLSSDQMAYAADDVRYLLELRLLISKRLEELERLEWALEECEIARCKNRTDLAPEEAWWKLPHARQLRGGARLVAQEVAAWRERRARQLDLPVRFVVSDLAVSSMAQRPPQSREDLSRSRGIDARQVSGQMGEELLGAVRRGRQGSQSELRLPPAQPFERPNRPVIALASAYVSQHAADLQIDPAILATRADLVAFFQDEPTGRLTDGWRCNLLGVMLRRLSEGDAALAFDGADRLVLEERSKRPLFDGLVPRPLKDAGGR